jgi:hypothetical protein
LHVHGAKNFDEISDHLRAVLLRYKVPDLDFIFFHTKDNMFEKDFPKEANDLIPDFPIFLMHKDLRLKLEKNKILLPDHYTLREDSLNRINLVEWK